MSGAPCGDQRHFSHIGVGIFEKFRQQICVGGGRCEHSRGKQPIDRIFGARECG